MELDNVWIKQEKLYNLWTKYEVLVIYFCCIWSENGRDTEICAIILNEKNYYEKSSDEDDGGGNRNEKVRYDVM